MDGIFIISFLFLLIGSFFMDRKMLRQEKKGIKMTYGITVGIILLFLTMKIFHISIPMPSYFFVKIVSPWLIRVLGV
ncbi:hypothetical protein [Paenibacillus oryzisoli]|uniref:Uncharacterized protein n=1 Tax=Paenibacillus oryzisoli TaxID=1850517 RepID=A0A198AHZ1_9BACL|nr:hypothetical protein [Paenibacillus oryzisoli]OAS20558.1 hypothetical protein A8708_18570 [Paenibacillus oryzisoli]